MGRIDYIERPLDINWTPWKITLLYLVVSSLYIVFSDRLILFITQDPSFLAGIQTIKGLIFVLFSAVLIYILVQKTTEDLKQSLRREASLKTLLTQDMFSKVQYSTGNMQLLEDMDISEEERNYLEKAIDGNMEALDLITEVKNISQMENFEGGGEVILVNMIHQAIKKNQGILEEVDIDFDQEGLEGERIKGDSRVKDLFSSILKISVMTQDSDTIKINGNLQKKELIAVIENDGNKIHEEVKKELMNGYPYLGNTTGVGGLRFYILSRLLDNYGAEIDIGKSSMGGARFEIVFPRS